MTAKMTNANLALQTRKLIAIKRAVSRHFDIPEKYLYCKNRQYGIAGPRMIAMYLCRVLTTASYPDIGHAFQKKHSTAMHAFETTVNRMTNNAAFAKKVEQARDRSETDLRAIKQ